MCVYVDGVHFRDRSSDLSTVHTRMYLLWREAGQRHPVPQIALPLPHNAINAPHTPGPHQDSNQTLITQNHLQNLEIRQLSKQ